MEEKEVIPSFLRERLEQQYGIEMTQNIIKGYRQKRKVTFRVNTLKTTSKEIKEKLEKENIEVEKVPWSEDAFILKYATEKDIQRLSMYEKGEIYLQSLSSMLPPLILEPKSKENILDMTAAPGSKTTQMAAMTNNQAWITACEMNSIRAQRLSYNIEKQGVKGVYVMVKDARKLDDLFSFDKILLDAPCSGSGTILLQEEKISITEKLIEKSSQAQLTLLKKAIQLLKPGHEMVYSTCSILACENEDIVKKALQGSNARLIPIEMEGLDSIPCLPVKIKGTLCVAPSQYYEGFFVAKIKKESNRMNT